MNAANWLLLCAGQTLIGLLWDRFVGDPPGLPHPARWVGGCIARTEASLRARMTNLRLAGVLLWLVTVGVATGAAALLFAALAGLDRVAGHADPYAYAGFGHVQADPGGWPWFTLVGGGVACGVWFSWRSLADEAAAVHAHLARGDLPAARRALAGIVGRDTDALGEEAIARAAVETVAENSVDGGLSPVVFSLLGGPVLLTLFKAASTLDSMVGYRNDRYRDLGAASARIDDALNYVPARLALLLVPLAALVSGFRPAGAWRIGRRDGRRHPSPNAAIGESLFAGALGIQLGGPSTYGGVPSQKPRLGDPDRPVEAGDIPRANLLLFALWAWTACITLLVALIRWATLPPIICIGW